VSFFLLSWIYYYFYYNHPVIISMFIGQGISIEDRRAAQAERRAANNVMAAASTAAALVAAERSADVATVTAAAPRLPPPRRTAQLDDQVPKKFPGEKGIMRPNMVPFLLVIFLSWIQFDPMSRSAIATAGRHRNGRSSINVFLIALMAWVGNLSCGVGMMGGKSSRRLSCVLFLAIPRLMGRTMRGLRRML
jgi:hypothetical protein